MAYIDINDVTSGGGGGGDASAANQLIQITLSTTTNSLITTTNSLITTSNSLLTDIDSKLFPIGTSINQYHEVLSVASGILTTIVSYTVPVSTKNVLERVSVSGENIALYTVLINGTIIDSQRTYFGGALNTQFEFMSTINFGTVLNAGDVVSVNVLHNRPSLANFESRIQMSEIV